MSSCRRPWLAIPGLPDRLQGFNFQANGDRVPQPPYPDLPDSAPALPGRSAYGLRPRHTPLWNTSLDSQWGSFSAWCTKPADPSRGDSTPPMSPKYFQNVQSTVSCYLGYVARSLELGRSMLTLAACLQPKLIVQFIRAKMQAAHEQESVAAVPAHLKKVLKWWADPAQQLSAAEVSRLEQLDAWLGSMSKLIKRTVPRKRKNREELDEQGE